MTAPVAPNTPEFVVMPRSELVSLVNCTIEAALERLQLAFPQPNASPAWLTLKEAAAMLRCHTSTVKRFIAQGRLKATQLASGGTSRVLVCRASVEALLQGCVR